MALRIRPLSDLTLDTPRSSGLQIRPLAPIVMRETPTGPVWAALDPPAYPGGPALSSFWPGPDTMTNPGGGEGVGEGSGSISGPTGGQIAASFGHLAGPSPLSAALTSLAAPTNTGTPAGLLSGIFGAVAPAPFGTLTGLVAHAMQQSAINDAVAKFPTVIHNEQDLSTIGANQGLSQAGINAALGIAQGSGPNVANSLAQGLGLTGAQLAGLNVAAFGIPTISGPDASGDAGIGSPGAVGGVGGPAGPGTGGTGGTGAPGDADGSDASSGAPRGARGGAGGARISAPGRRAC
jgi:hypothetical protein